MSVVFYFMDGCPACEATWPTWRKVKKMAKGQLKEVESKQVPPGADVSSFPTFVILDENGQEVERVEGRRTDASGLMSELKLKKKSGGKRKTRRLRAGTTRRKIR